MKTLIATLALTVAAAAPALAMDGEASNYGKPAVLHMQDLGQLSGFTGISGDHNYGEQARDRGVGTTVGTKAPAANQFGFKAVSGEKIIGDDAASGGTPVSLR